MSFSLNILMVIWSLLYSVFLLKYQVACMQFINIVVHSVEDMNFRVHLQYEFTKLCLDDFLEVRTRFQSPHRGFEHLQANVCASSSFLRFK